MEILVCAEKRGICYMAANEMMEIPVCAEKIEIPVSAEQECIKSMAVSAMLVWSQRALSVLLVLASRCCSMRSRRSADGSGRSRN